MTYTKTGTGSSECYTPEYLTTAAAQLMGGIHLDPASSGFANRTVAATMYYGRRDDGTFHDGLARQWFGKVWLNPPYGRAEKVKLGGWISKLIAEYSADNCTQACVIVPAFTAQKWFKPLFDFPICFLSKRVKFVAGDSGVVMASPMYAHCIVWLPEKGLLESTAKRRFAAAFHGLGTVVSR